MERSDPVNGWPQRALSLRDMMMMMMTYIQNSTWNKLTGKYIEQLWADYSENPDLISNIPFIKATTTTIEMITKTF
jgi:hypothetical protein